MTRKKEHDFLNKLSSILLFVYKDYKCGICHDLLQDPLECSRCQNIFCRKCIFKMVELKGTPTICPYKCENITYMVPSQTIRKHISNFQDLENEIKEICQLQNVQEQQINVESLIDEYVQHITQCDLLYVNCKDCMFKVQRKDLLDHTQHCEKTQRNAQQCHLCGITINNGHIILHLQECEESIKCEQCNLKYDKDDDLHANCIEYLKLHNSEKEKEFRHLQTQLDSTQKMNINLVEKLAEERKNYKELIKCKGKVCNFCEKPMEFAQQVNCAACTKHSCGECFPENMFYCYECKRSFCKKCKNCRKTYICDKHI